MPVDQAYTSLLEGVRTIVWPNALQYVITLAPIILAIFLAKMAWELWIRYIRAKFYNSLKYTVLELKLPKDTFKSPAAMEAFFHSIHNTSDGNFFLRFWKGEYRPYYSLELASIEGQVKFFVWLEDRRKAGFLTGLYSQFPTIEVTEREDYTRGVHFDGKTMKLWGCEMKFTKDFKKDGPYPIKTYIDYGLDKDPKEEFKVDPLLPLLEWLGSVGPNQQVWIQIMVRAHIKGDRKPGTLFKRTDAWHDKAEKMKNELLLRNKDTKVAGVLKKETGFVAIPTFTKGEQEVIAAIERHVSKLAFDVGIRALYFAPKESFDTPFGIGGIIGNFKVFNTEHLNGFKPNGDKWIAQLDYPWQDFRNMRRNRLSRLAMMAYKRRSFFYPPFDGTPMVMNTEELATIYHFPGSVAATPTLERVPSKKAQAPANLPI